MMSTLRVLLGPIAALALAAGCSSTEKPKPTPLESSPWS